MLLRFHCNAVLPKMKENLLNFFRIFSRQSPHVVSNSGAMVMIAFPMAKPSLVIRPRDLTIYKLNSIHFDSRMDLIT